MFLVGDYAMIIIGIVIFILFIIVIKLLFILNDKVIEKDELQDDFNELAQNNKNYIANHDRYVENSKKIIREKENDVF